MVKHLPRLEWDDIVVKKKKSYKNDSTDYSITVSYRNTGKLPTALKQAHLVKIVQEDRLTLTFDRSLVSGDSPAIRILTEEPGRRRRSFGPSSQGGRSEVSLNAGFTDGGATSKLVFEIRVYGNSEVNGHVSLASTRGGVLEQKTFVVR